jgi:hypothetical protein
MKSKSIQRAQFWYWATALADVVMIWVILELFPNPVRGILAALLLAALAVHLVINSPRKQAAGSKQANDGNGN